MTEQNPHHNADKNWPKGEFAWHEVLQFWWWVPFLLLIAAATLLPSWGFLKSKPDVVVLYCAQDQSYAEPILRQFESESGLRVLAVYDSEAVKTVGLANRLLAERAHPACDVFWGNEEMRTRQLAAQGVWDETNGFTAFGARVRCLVRGTQRTDLPWPTSLFDLTNQVWRGKVAIAYPQFGTTATHFQVLRQHWGPARWESWCRGLVANDVKVLDGNSTVVKMVARGEAWIGLTDTDDVAAAQRDGLAVERGPDLTETLLFIPNTVGIVRGAPHPGNARQLARYLQQPSTVDQLRACGAITYSHPPDPDQPRLDPDWETLLTHMDPTSKTLSEIFLR